MATLDDVRKRLAAGQSSLAINIYDKSGKMIESSPYTDELKTALKTGQPIYKTADGSWKTTPQVSVKLNTETGNIDIKAPQTFLDNPSFKEGYLNNDELIQVSKAYKLDKNFKVPDPADENKEISLPDLVENYYNKPLQQYADTVASMEEERYNVRQLTKNDALADALTESDFMYMHQNAIGDNVDDKTLISVPKTLTGDFFANTRALADYNSEYGVITRGALRDSVYNIGEGERDNITAAFTEASTRLAEISKKEEITAEDAEEYARLTAFLSYMQSEKPEADFLTQQGLNIEAGAKGLMAVAHNVGGNLLVAGEALVNFVHYVTSPQLWGDHSGRGASTYMLETYQADQQSDEEVAAELALINDGAAAIYTITELGGTIAGTMLLGNVAGKAVTNAITSTATVIGLNNALAKVTATATQGASKAAGKTASALASASVTGALGGIPTTNSLINTAQSILRLSRLDPALTAESVNGLMNLLTRVNRTKDVVQAINQSVKTVNNLNKAATAVDTVSQIVVDTLIDDAPLMRKALEENDNEAAGELWRAVAVDAALFGAGLGGAAIMTKFPNTRLGRTVNTRIAQIEAKVSVAASSAKEKIKSMVLHDADYVKSIKSASKRQVAEMDDLIRQATKNVAEAGEGLTGWDKTLDIEKNLQNLVAIQNVADMRVNGYKAIHSQMFNATTAPDMATVYSRMVASEKRIMALEKQYGLNKRANYITRKDGSYVSQTTRLTNNYRNGIYRLEMIENHHAATKAYGPGMEDEMERIKQFNAEFEASYPELAKEAASSLQIYKDGAKTFNIWSSQHKVVNLAQLQRMQNAPRFKNGFMHTERFMDVTNQDIDVRVLQRKVSTVPSIQSYAFGSKADFISPFDAFMNNTLETAHVLNSREMLRNTDKVKGLERKVLYTGEEIERVKEVNALKNDFHKAVVRNFKGSKERVVENSLSVKLGQSLSAHKEKLNFGAKVGKEGRAVSRAKVADYKVTGVAKTQFLDSMLPDEVAEQTTKHVGVSFTNILEDEYDNLVNPSAGVKGDRFAQELRKSIRLSIASNADYITGAIGVGGSARETLSDLPKIKTSSYKKLMGIKTLKDADPDIRPYLSESGVDLESGDWGQFMQGFQGDFEGGGSFSGTPDEVVDFYTRMIKEARAEREIYQPTYQNYLQAVQFDPELPSRLNRIALRHSDFYTSSELDDMVKTARREATVEELNNVWEKGLKEYAKLAGLDAAQEKQLVEAIDDVITDFIYSGVLDNDEAGVVITKLMKDVQNQDAATEYIVLSELVNSKKELGGEIDYAIKNVVKQELSNYNLALPEGEKIDVDDAYEKFARMFNDAVFDRRNRAAEALRAENSPLVDEKGIYAEINEIERGIKQAASNKTTVVSSPNLDGLTEYYEVNPMVADIVNKRPVPAGGDSWWSGLLYSKGFEYSNRVFRLGSTTLNPRSFLNQAFRDPISGFVGSGATRPAYFTERLISDNFGENIAEFYRVQYPEIYKQIERQAKEAGTDVGSQATRYAGATLESEVVSSTETAQYRLHQTSTAFDSMQSAAEKALKAAEAPGNLREVGVRKAVAMQTLHDAMKRGYTYEESMNLARRVMRDSTTNFLRQTYHLQALTNTTPYLRAGINGTKSFWRLASIDPVGVFTRITTGLVLPTIFATAAILTDEEGREYYKTLSEREKDSNIIFKVGGQFVSVPIPQELYGMVAPWRHLTESLYNGNRHAFWELAINDLVGLFPYNLQGFQDIDGVQLGSDPTILERIGSAGMGLLADVLPPIGKTAFELTYGVDPYTGKKIDRSYTYLDDNGDMQIMDSTTSEFAQWVGNLTGWSPSVVSTLVSNFTGSFGRDVLDSVVSLGQWVSTGGKSGSPLRLIEKTGAALGDVMTVAEYDRTKSAWNTAVAQLYERKREMLPEYEERSAQIANETDPERRKVLIAKRNDFIAPYAQEVKQVVADFQSQYGGAIDTYRFATVVSLLNFARTTESGTTAYSRLEGQQALNDKKAEARQTIQNMNIASSPDTPSLLGNMYVDKNGEVQVSFYTPLEILNAQSIWYGQGELHASAVEELLITSGITKQLSTAWDNIRSMETTRQKDQAKLEWDAKVVKVLEPYFDRYGVEAVMRDERVTEYLDKYFLVPSAYMRNNGRSVWSPNLDRQSGFAEQYIRDVMSEVVDNEQSR